MVAGFSFDQNARSSFCCHSLRWHRIFRLIAYGKVPDDSKTVLTKCLAKDTDQQLVATIGSGLSKIIGSSKSNDVANAVMQPWLTKIN
jgi:hypothetical protein